MRVIPLYEKKKRGCQYCLHSKKNRIEGQLRTCCPFSNCQYPVLDKYESYEEFMESEDSKILVDEFFTSVAGCYGLAKQECSPKKIFSDGDGKIGF